MFPLLEQNIVMQIHRLFLLVQILFLKKNTVISYSGDHGIITGIGTTSLGGVAVTGLVFDLVIPSDSFLRKSEFTQGASGSGMLIVVLLHLD